jgi:peptidoglycan/xylan/chitin deacetylase (PgdA/CDA1 family)
MRGFFAYIVGCLTLLCAAAELSTIYSFDEKKVQKTIALTFDDGPHGTLTPRLLDVLKAKNVKVTFFVMGIKAVMHPDILKRAHEEGHEIANHVWDHPVLSKIPREQVHDQLERTTAAIQAAISVPPKVMRPPYGNTNKGLNEFIYKNDKLKVILWSYDTNDWKRPAPSEIVSKTVAKIKPGAVILCHDIHPGTIAAMPELIDKLHAAGYKFQTVSGLLAMQEQQAPARRHLRGTVAEEEKEVEEA